MAEKEVPKNEFREEIAKTKLNEKKLNERDAFAVYLWLKNSSGMVEADHVYIQSAIEKINAFANEIFKLPNSELRKVLLQDSKARTEALIKQRDACRMHPKDTVLLAVLEEKFGETEKIDRGEK